MSGISTHVLDTARGRPATGVPVVLEMLEADGTSTPIGVGATDSDGRIRQLLPEGFRLKPGTHRLTFDVQSYFAAGNQDCFYPRVIVVFIVRDIVEHYHVPLLLSSFGYSTYRGS